MNIINSLYNELYHRFIYRVNGIFVYRIDLTNQIKKGDIAGWFDSQFGYWKISIKNKIYKRSRLVWLYHHGSWPKFNIDHINRIRFDDRIENLRDVNQSHNLRNANWPVNKFGKVGVYQRKNKRWRAYIKVNRKTIYLGTYITFNNAVKARLKAERKYNFMKGGDIYTPGTVGNSP